MGTQFNRVPEGFPKEMSGFYEKRGFCLEIKVQTLFLPQAYRYRSRIKLSSATKRLSQKTFLLVTPVDILKTHNIILAEIAADLHFNQLEWNDAWVF